MIRYQTIFSTAVLACLMAVTFSAAQGEEQNDNKAADLFQQTRCQ